MSTGLSSDGQAPPACPLADDVESVSPGVLDDLPLDKGPFKLNGPVPELNNPSTVQLDGGLVTDAVDCLVDPSPLLCSCCSLLASIEMLLLIFKAVRCEQSMQGICRGCSRPASSSVRRPCSHEQTTGVCRDRG